MEISLSLLSVYVLLLSLAICSFYGWSRARSTRLPLPPGPKPLPVLGNIFDIPQGVPIWKLFEDWGRQYGDLIYIHTLGRPMLVINSVDIARELLEMRGAIYSSRPALTMANEVVGWKFSTASMTYCDALKTHRKLLRQYFHPRKYPSYYTLQHKQVLKLLKDIAQDPQHLSHHVKAMTGGVVALLAYGHQIEGWDDPFITIAERGVATIQVIGAVGAHIVDFIPWLRFIPDWVPGAGFKRLPPGTREDLQAFVRVPFEQVKKKMAEGSSISCYVSDLLNEVSGSDEDAVRDTAAGIYTGGFDTTYSTAMAAIVNIVANPVIQARMQAEMDSVLGKAHLPRLEDRERLPYVHCVVLEALRWLATTPVGVPHFLTEPDTYNGYRLPGGMMVMANAWAMLHDDRVYPEPAKFNPDRFLEGENKSPQPDPRLPAFGFGRRVCPGAKIAESVLWLTIANVVYSFTVNPIHDANGNVIPIDLNCDEGTVRHVKPFQCNVQSRRGNSLFLVQ